MSMFLFAWSAVGCKKGDNDSSSQTSIDSSQSAEDSQSADSSQDSSNESIESESSDSGFELGPNELPPIEIP